MRPIKSLVLLLLLTSCAAVPRCGGPNRDDMEPACDGKDGTVCGDQPAPTPIPPIKSDEIKPISSETPIVDVEAPKK